MKLLPAQERTAFIYPFMGEVGRGGLLIARHSSVPPVLGRVLVAHPSCNQIKTGDVVVYRPHRFTVGSSSVGDINVIHESSIEGIIAGYDQGI